MRAEKLLEKCAFCYVATIAFLYERGLPLRGSNEIIAPGNNGEAPAGNMPMLVIWPTASISGSERRNIFPFA